MIFAKLNYGILALCSGTIISLFAEIPGTLPVAQQVESYERVAVSALLLSGLVYLYKRNEKLNGEYKKFVETQLKEFRESQNKQTAVIAGLALNIEALTKSNDAQIELYQSKLKEMLEDSLANRKPVKAED